MFEKLKRWYRNGVVPSRALRRARLFTPAEQIQFLHDVAEMPLDPADKIGFLARAWHGPWSFHSRYSCPVTVFRETQNELAVMLNKSMATQGRLIEILSKSWTIPDLARFVLASTDPQVCALFAPRLHEAFLAHGAPDEYTEWIPGPAGDIRLRPEMRGLLYDVRTHLERVMGRPWFPPHNPDSVFSELQASARHRLENAYAIFWHYLSVNAFPSNWDQDGIRQYCLQWLQILRNTVAEDKTLNLGYRESYPHAITDGALCDSILAQLEAWANGTAVECKLPPSGPPIWHRSARQHLI